MAKRKRRSSKLRSLPKAAEVVAFTEAEEAFFREGVALESSAQLAAAESFDDLESGEERPGFWRRLFSVAA